MGVTEKILDFAEKYGKYENLPESVVHEVKMTLLDGIGNALAGISSDKGKIGVSMAHELGGQRRGDHHRKRRKGFGGSGGLRERGALKRA